MGLVNHIATSLAPSIFRLGLKTMVRDIQLNIIVKDINY